MNVHEAVDVGTIALSGALLRDAKFFSRSLESPSIVDVAADARGGDDGFDATRAGVHDVIVETPIGDFEAAYMPWRWLGPDESSPLIDTRSEDSYEGWRIREGNIPFGPDDESSDEELERGPNKCTA